MRSMVDRLAYRPARAEGILLDLCFLLIVSPTFYD